MTLFRYLWGGLISLLIAIPAHSQNTSDTRLLQTPATSQDRIAFVYAEDLWIANRDGGNPRRLTIDEGVESNPVFSPDGNHIAFTAQYDGNMDVFVVSSMGGVPKRLTWHPGMDRVLDFTPDGSAVLFMSQRATFTNRHAKFYTIALDGGRPEELPVPSGFTGTLSPDGKYIAYNPLYEAFNQWKNYRGGTQSRIWIMDLESHEVTEVPKPASGSNDADPEWVGNRVYFRSDRDGEFNLYSYDQSSGQVVRHTEYKDFGVLNLNSHGSDLVYEQAGYIHRLDTQSGRSERMVVGIATDLLELRPRYVSGPSYVRNASVSPSAARVVLDYRGEVVTVPGEMGDVVNHSNTPGVHEKYPTWSPDGNHIAYFSDASGEYELHIREVKSGKVRKISLQGAGFYAYPHWSPDNGKIALVDNSRSLYVVDLSSGKMNKVASDASYVPGSFRELFGSWSADSNWISYTTIKETNFEQAFAYSLSDRKSYPLSDGLSDVSQPVFDPSGKYLYMLASTDAGPVVNWFDQSNQDMESSYSIYLVTLQSDTPSPLAKKNDLEAGEKPESSEDTDKKKKKKSDQKDKPAMRIDWDGITSRIIDLPIEPGTYGNLATPEEGKLYYVDRAADSDGSTLMVFDLKEQEGKEVMKADEFQIAARGEKLLYRRGRTWGIAPVGKKPEGNMLDLNAIEVKIDPRKEWENIFEEAWKVNRDYFYDPGMHGADWLAMKEKYRVFLGDVSCRSDLYRVMQWMFSELAVGYHRFTGRGDQLRSPERVGGGLLGADYEVSGNRYRFKKIYGGLNWNPGLRSPLTEPGVNVNEGDYLIAVNGKQLTADQNLYSFFENTAGKLVELTVSPSSSGSSSRNVQVVPVGSENALRNRDWIEGNISKVSAATDGRVGYVYVPNTAAAGHEYFKRYFFPQADKEALIVDERFNGGGQLADYYIDQLRKPYQSSWAFRYGKDQKAPNASVQGPKVLLIDETAGSGGDYFPYLFRKFGLGKLIGKRTWGGLVGILGYPEFIDGGGVTAPNLAFYDEDGFGIENVGVAPDIEVEQWPVQVNQGKDPQLEKAIEVILGELRTQSTSYPKRPDYPNRTRNE